MPFREDKVRFERFSADSAYHAAYNFLSLKGVLAERWAHGPVFGAFADTGNQITLTPGPDPEIARPTRLVQAFYGLKSSGFHYEQLPRSEVGGIAEIAAAWHKDAMTVLVPRRTTQLVVGWFLLHPISNPEKSSRLLRERYYKSEATALLKPERYSSYHSAVETLIDQGDEAYTIVLGVVGPPHKGQFFAHAGPDRDSRWWMGLRTSYSRRNDDGLEEPAEQIRDMISQSRIDVIELARIGFRGLID